MYYFSSIFCSTPLVVKEPSDIKTLIPQSALEEWRSTSLKQRVQQLQANALKDFINQFVNYYLDHNDAEKILSTLQGIISDQQLQSHLMEDIDVFDAVKCETVDQSKKEWPVFFKTIFNLINLFFDTLNIVNIDKNTLTLFERQLVFFIIFKCISIPYSLTQSLAPIVGAKVYIAAYTGLASLSICLYIYQKWIQTVPQWLSFAERMDVVVKKYTTRHALLNDFMNQLHRHVMIVAPSGYGKTALVESLQYELTQTHQEALPSHLRQRTFFRINCEELAKKYDKDSRLTRLRHEIDGQEERLILFFDEVHHLLKDETCFNFFKTFLDKKDLICIGATTPEGSLVLKTMEQDAAPTLEPRWPIFKLPEVSNPELQAILIDTYQRKTSAIFKKTGIHVDIDTKNPQLIDLLITKSRDLQEVVQETQPRCAIKCLEDLIVSCEKNFITYYRTKELNQLKDKLQSAKKMQKFFQFKDDIKQIQEEIEVENQKIRSRIAAAQRYQKLTHQKCILDQQKPSMIYRHFIRPRLEKKIEDHVKESQEHIHLLINQKSIECYFEGRLKVLSTKKEEIK